MFTQLESCKGSQIDATAINPSFCPRRKWALKIGIQSLKNKQELFIFVVFFSYLRLTPQPHFFQDILCMHFYGLLHFTLDLI